MNFLKKAVSGPKARTKDASADLDLVYLTPRIILMGWPAAGLEAVYRNKMEHVVAFLDSKHADAYRVFNLCPLSENSYPPTSFHSRLSRYPFPDHHPPPLPLLHVATQEMEDWLNRNPKNVVVIHCKAGKGRTGTMACCLVERLGGVINVKTAHGILEGDIDIPGKKEDDSAHGEGEDVEGGSISGPTTLTSAYSEEPVVLTNPPVHSASAPEKKKKHKKGTSKYTIPEPEKFEQHPGTELFQFHTSRRMANPNSTRPGVSIPSQRRFVGYYMASLRHLNTPVDSSKSLPLPSIYPAPNDNVPPVMLRIRTITLTHAHSGSSSTTPKIRAEVARYQDSFVADLEEHVAASAAAAREPDEDARKKMGKLTFSQLEGAGGLGIGMGGFGTEEVGGEGKVGDAASGGGSVRGGGMVRVLGVLREEKVEVGEKDFVDGEATSTPLLTHHLTPIENIIVHPNRELKIQLLLGDEQGTPKSVSGLMGLKSKGLKSSGMNALLGQSVSSLGWVWMIPSFHIPSSSSSSSTSTTPDQPRTHTLIFPRELVDFRSKSMRTVKVVFEEVPNKVDGTKDRSGESVGGVKGEVVPKESERVGAVMLGGDGKTEGGEHA